MMNIFLKLKSWQLFVLIITPMLIPMFLVHDPESFKWFGAITLVWMLVLVGLLYAVGSTANKKLPESLRKNTFIYKTGFVIAVFYAVVIAIGIFPYLDHTSGPRTRPPTWLLPLHLASMFGMFYGLWFTAKQFVTLQKNQRVKFVDYYGPFFLFWFSPIGVWFIQPRINELFFEKEHNDAS